MKLTFVTTFNITLSGGDTENFPSDALAAEIEATLNRFTSNAFIEAIRNVHDNYAALAVIAALHRWSFDVKRSADDAPAPRGQIEEAQSADEVAAGKSISEPDT